MSDDGWNEVRRSIPAEHVEEVPDDATVWACWIEQDGPRGITVYKSETEGAYYVLQNVDEEEALWTGPTSEEEAMDEASDLRSDDDLWWT